MSVKNKEWRTTKTFWKFKKYHCWKIIPWTDWKMKLKSTRAKDCHFLNLSLAKF